MNILLLVCLKNSPATLPSVYSPILVFVSTQFVCCMCFNSHTEFQFSSTYFCIFSNLLPNLYLIYALIYTSWLSSSSILAFWVYHAISFVFCTTWIMQHMTKWDFLKKLSHWKFASQFINISLKWVLFKHSLLFEVM